MTDQPIQLPQLEDARRASWRCAAGGVAIVAGVFAAVVAAVLLREMVREHRENPLEARRLAVLQTQLAKEPTEPLKQEIREEDLRIRRQYFRRVNFVQTGVWMLLGGALMLAVSAKMYFKLAERPRMPGAPDPEANLDRTQVLARWALGVGGLMTAVTLGAVAMLPGAPKLVASGTGATTQPSVTVTQAIPDDAASDEQMRANWPAFRGFNGLAIAPKGEYPKQWDGAAGKNVLWKTAVPLEGMNSPIVWEDKVFLSASDGLKREVYCFDAKTGSLLWQQLVSKTDKPIPDPESAISGGPAPNTMATDGKRVYAIFPSGDVAGYDMAGKRLWGRNLGLPENTYGHSTSLITYKGLVLIQLDHGQIKAGKSALIALDGATGREAWRTRRTVESSWSSPAIVPGPKGPQLILYGHPTVAAYDPGTGSEIWFVKGTDGEVAPSPTYSNGMVYVCVERSDLFAIRLDGMGDVTESHVKWKISEGFLPDVVSPLAVGELIFLVKDGQLVCVEVGKDEPVWEQEMKPAFHASPILVGDTIYLLDQDGLMHLFKPERKFAETTAPLGEKAHATPAFAGGRIYIRGEKHLYCIGNR